MQYRDCLDYLDQLGHEVLSMNFGLDRIRALLRELGEPQLAYPSVLIAGTNGKGALSRFLSSAATSCGLRSGRFSSPHIKSIRERICINEVDIDRDAFARAFSRVRDAAQKLPHHPTYFEMLTALAFDHFEACGIDLAVLEVGMGGRLDSTNVVEPLLSIIMPIGLDHQQYLGNTIERIAREKAGIIHQGVPVVSAPQTAEALEVLRRAADQAGAPLTVIVEDHLQIHHVEKGRYSIHHRDMTAELSVLGRHQAVNAAVAMEALTSLRSRFPSLQGSCIARAVAGVQPYGTLQPIADDPYMIVDGGHNPDAARAVTRFLLEHTESPRNLVFSAMQDKALEPLAHILTPHFEKIFLHPLRIPRAASAHQMKEVFPGASVVEDLNRLLQLSKAGVSTVLVFGSFRLAEAVLSLEPPASSEGRAGSHSI